MGRRAVEPGGTPGAATRTAVLVLTFLAGVSALAVEVSASQLLAPWFGASINVWGVLIGMVLLYLSAGYLLGGRLADRYPRAPVFFFLLAAAGVWIILIPLASGPLLPAVQFALRNLAGGAVLATLVAVVVLFAAPTIALGAASPFAIRLLLVEVPTGGNTAGRVYALSTAGSIAGALIPVFGTIPYLGTAQTFVGAGILLLLVPVAAGCRRLLLRSTSAWPAA